MKFIFENKPERKTWVLIPTAILYLKGAELEYNSVDLTFTWLCFGFTVRFESI